MIGFFALIGSINLNIVSKRSISEADKMVFYDLAAPAFLTVAFILELLGIIVICYGVGIYTLKLIRQSSKGLTPSHELSNYLMLSLDYMLGAEIIRTVVARTIEELTIVGTIIVLRGALGYIIHQEVKENNRID